MKEKESKTKYVDCYADYSHIYGISVFVFVGLYGVITFTLEAIAVNDVGKNCCGRLWL